MRIEKTVGIARPPEEVWTFIADARNDPQWCDKVDSVDQIAGDGPGQEARYRVLHRPVRLRKAKELAVTVEEYEPPRQLRFREEDDDATFEVTCVQRESLSCCSRGFASRARYVSPSDAQRIVERRRWPTKPRCLRHVFLRVSGWA